MEEKERLLFKKAARILISLRDSSKRWILSNLAKANNATFVYTSRIVDKLAKLGLVKSEKKGKVKEVKLTEDGQKIAEALSTVIEKEKVQTQQPQQPQQQQQPTQPSQPQQVSQQQTPQQAQQTQSAEKQDTENKKEKKTTQP
jgi:predicted transcriptional regulator